MFSCLQTATSRFDKKFLVVQISDALEKILQKRPKKGPLAEVEFWCERATSLCAIYDSLKTPRVRRLLDLFATIENSMQVLVSEVGKHYEEASEIARFLRTVERHFKNLQFGVSFRSVAETITPIIKSLRLVWSVSRNYNNDEKVEHR